MSPLLVALCVVVAVPGLLLRRFGAAAPRLVALGVLAVLAWGALDPVLLREEERTGKVLVVPTAARPTAELLAALRAAAAPAEVVSVGLAGTTPGGDGLPLAQGAAGAWLGEAGSGEASTLAVVWTGDFDPVELQGSRMAAAIAVSAVAAPLLEPDACALRALGPAEAGRPVELEVQLVDVPVAAAARAAVTAARVAILGPDAQAVHQVDLSVDAFVTGAPVAVRFEPAAAGAHAVELRIELSAPAGGVLQGRGELVVAAPRRVLVLGAAAPALARALEVQGLVVATASQLPEDLGALEVVVALEPLDRPTQEALTRFVDEGGGLFLVAADEERRGGALPVVGEPLAELLPVEPLVRRPPAIPAPTAEGAGDPLPSSTPEVSPENESRPVPPEPQPEVPAPEPPPDPPPDPPPEENPKPAQGRIDNAKLLEGPEREVDRRTVAIVLVIDRSASMNQHTVTDGVSRMGYAKRAAIVNAQKLQEGDLVGVVTFGQTGQVALPLTDATHQEEIRRRVEALRPTAQTTLLADALNKTREMLLACDAAVRRAVVISDGQIHDGKIQAPLAARRAFEAGITVSVIQLTGGERLDAQASAAIAQQGGGVFRMPLDPREIPGLVSVEVVSTLGQVGRLPAGESGPAGDPAPPEPEPEPEPEVEPEPEPEPEPEVEPEPEPEVEPEAEQIWLPVVATRPSRPSPLLAPQTADFPAVGGVQPVEARPEAQVLLLVRQGEEGVPLLAFANRGLGKVAVWTSGLLDPWGARWRADRDFPARLAQWISSLMRPLPRTGGADLVGSSELTPPAPVAAQRAAILAWTGTPLRPIDDLVPPPPQVIVRSEGRARELALLGLLALALLVLVEFLVRGRST